MSHRNKNQSEVIRGDECGDYCSVDLVRGMAKEARRAEEGKPKQDKTTEKRPNKKERQYEKQREQRWRT
ncbi:hypothetical protein PILCRDRAFT_830283 [Piloderma croceum F 1598]|uniref:Uncharacterized protein n=1 Tax=Piloderma croceum (strain F 1598) TaxID=765440 RepID=A0A0C3ETW8_PILCF|nr:hypothetical protein PILCRDRAFT_830283 [Piloderma croceum F 1598]